jgi:hypothetical protein
LIKLTAARELNRIRGLIRTGIIVDEKMVALMAGEGGRSPHSTCSKPYQIGQP